MHAGDSSLFVDIFLKELYPFFGLKIASSVQFSSACFRQGISSFFPYGTLHGWHMSSIGVQADLYTCTQARWRSNTTFFVCLPLPTRCASRSLRCSVSTARPPRHLGVRPTLGRHSIALLLGSAMLSYTASCHLGACRVLTTGTNVGNHSFMVISEDSSS